MLIAFFFFYNIVKSFKKNFNFNDMVWTSYHAIKYL